MSTLDRPEKHFRSPAQYMQNAALAKKIARAKRIHGAFCHENCVAASAVSTQAHANECGCEEDDYDVACMKGSLRHVQDYTAFQGPVAEEMAGKGGVAG